MDLASFFPAAFFAEEPFDRTLFFAAPFFSDATAATREAFFDLAQRSLCAAAILARASGLSLRRFRDFPAKRDGSKLVALFAVAGRPLFRNWMTPILVSSAFAFCKRTISASIAIRISFVFNYNLHQRA